MNDSKRLTAEEIFALTSSVYEEAIAYRKLFHENPEIGFEVEKTSAAVESFLRKLGIEVHTGYAKTGVIGILRGNNEGPVIALRADMDALPIQEQTGVPFASKIPNVMHACGHDMHTAMLLGAAKALSQVKQKINGTIKFIFQPAEEMLGGGRVMVEDGALKNPDVDFIYGFHVWPDTPLGQFSIKSGPQMASMDTFQVTLKGKSGHGATPQQGIDAIVGSAQIITGIQSIISRQTDPLDSAVITIGSLTAGTGFNIIPEKATFSGTVRTIHQETRDRIKEDFFRVVKGMSSALRLEPKIDYQYVLPITSNDHSCVEHIQSVAKLIYGQDAISPLENPSMASEDFSYYLEKAPGAFIFLGVKDDHGGAYKLHHEKFLPDESAMKYGISLYIALATNLKK